MESSFSGIRTAQDALTNIDGRIMDYENKLRDPKTLLVTLQFGVTVFI
jgi:hypothetical protein